MLCLPAVASFTMLFARLLALWHYCCGTRCILLTQRHLRAQVTGGDKALLAHYTLCVRLLFTQPRELLCQGATSRA